MCVFIRYVTPWKLLIAHPEGPLCMLQLTWPLDRTTLQAAVVYQWQYSRSLICQSDESTIRANTPFYSVLQSD